jgi:histidine ammonia-lyase
MEKSSELFGPLPIALSEAEPARPPRIVALGRGPLAIEDVVLLATGAARAELDGDPAFRRRLAAGSERLAEHLAAGRQVYGVTTGFGESCLNPIASLHVADLPLNLVRFHGCGVGEILADEESAAVVASRLASLSSGWSAVRPLVLERLCDLLNHRLLPLIPALGSVGASGDLTPLSYVAAALLGEREVRHRGEVLAAADALRRVGLAPLSLLPKESLSLMNGTSMMTGLLCLAFDRARLLARLVAALTAMAVDVLGGNPGHFDDRLFAAKPHPGQRAVARWIREDLEPVSTTRKSARIQDRYSIRCVPHVAGVLVDALPWLRQWIETELNGANDNPLLDAETGEALHGGNFYGGHMCFAADALKTAVANLADLLDRQLLQLLSPAASNGLPENLVGAEGPGRTAHHGFKAMEIASSALAAEALKQCMPASVFSRSTEGHNQDKVSMGTIAARECLRVLDLTETVAAISTLALCQAVDLRRQEGCHARTLAIHRAVRERVPWNDRDRRQDRDIAQVLTLMRAGQLPAGAVDWPTG